jgi:hypothetical protein
MITRLAITACTLLVLLVASPRLWAETTRSDSNAIKPTAYACPAIASQNPDLAKDLRLEGEVELELSLRKVLKTCGDGVLSAWKDTINTLLVDPYVFMMKTSPEQTKNFLDKCNLSEICKNQLFYEAYGRLPSQVENQKISSSMSFADLDILYRNAKSRMNSTGEQNRRFRYELLNRKWLATDVPTKETLDPAQEKTSFWQLLKEIISNEREKFSCLKSEAAVELFCYYAAQIIDPLIVGGLVLKTPTIAKWAKLGLKKVKLKEAAMIEARAVAYGKTQAVFSKEEIAQLNVKAKAIADSKLSDDEKMARISSLYFTARISKLPKNLQEDAIHSIQYEVRKGKESAAFGTEIEIKETLGDVNHLGMLAHEFEHVIQYLDGDKKKTIQQYFKHAFGYHRGIEDEVEAIGAEWDVMQLIPVSKRHDALAKSIVEDGHGTGAHRLPDGTEMRVKGTEEQRRIDASLTLSREEYIRKMRGDSRYVGMTSVEKLMVYRMNLLMSALRYSTGIAALGYGASELSTP